MWPSCLCGQQPHTVPLKASSVKWLAALQAWRFPCQGQSLDILGKGESGPSWVRLREREAKRSELAAQLEAITQESTAPGEGSRPPRCSNSQATESRGRPRCEDCEGRSWSPLRPTGKGEPSARRSPSRPTGPQLATLAQNPRLGAHITEAAPWAALASLPPRPGSVRGPESLLPDDGSDDLMRPPGRPWRGPARVRLGTPWRSRPVRSSQHEADSSDPAKSLDSLVRCKPGWAAFTSYHHLRMDNLPRLRPSSQLSLLNLSNHPGRIPCHDRVRWNTPGDDCPCAHHCIPAYPHPWQEDGTAP
jgi:hypothetical protein